MEVCGKDRNPGNWASREGFWTVFLPEILIILTGSKLMKACLEYPSILID